VVSVVFKEDEALLPTPWVGEGAVVIVLRSGVAEVKARETSKAARSAADMVKVILRPGFCE